MNAVGWIGRTLRKSREEFSCFFGNSTIEPGVPLRRARLDALDTSGFLEGRAKKRSFWCTSGVFTCIMQRSASQTR